MLKINEIANIWPMLPDKKYQELKESISKIGLQVPIIIHNGEIVDGRNRARACEELGIEPQYVEMQGDDVIETVVETNTLRRQSSETQRAVAASKLANMSNGGNRQSAQMHSDISAEDAAKILGVSERMIWNIRFIEKNAPDLIPLLEGGVLTASAALREIQERKENEALGARTDKDKYGAFISRLGSEAWKDAVKVAARGSQQEKELAIEFLTNGDGEFYYKGSGYSGDYAIILDWVASGCQCTPMDDFIILTMCGNCEPLREYCPPSEDDEDDILYDLRHSR